MDYDDDDLVLYDEIDGNDGHIEPEPEPEPEPEQVKNKHRKNLGRPISEKTKIAFEKGRQLNIERGLVLQAKKARDKLERHDKYEKQVIDKAISIRKRQIKTDYLKI